MAKHRVWKTEVQNWYGQYDWLRPETKNLDAKVEFT